MYAEIGSVYDQYDPNPNYDPSNAYSEPVANTRAQQLRQERHAPTTMAAAIPRSVPDDLRYNQQGGGGGGGVSPTSSGSQSGSAPNSKNPSRSSSRRSIKSLKKALQATGRLIGIRTREQRAVRAAERELVEIERAARIDKIRQDLDNGVTLTEDDLREVARLDGVHLNPRPTRVNRHMADDNMMADGLVARLDGPTIENEYIFLSRDMALYIGEDRLGRRIRSMSKNNWHYGQNVDKARKYGRQLCR